MKIRGTFNAGQNDLAQSPGPESPPADRPSICLPTRAAAGPSPVLVLEKAAALVGDQELALSPAGLAALEKVSQKKVLYAFDLDGMFAPMVENPSEAQVPQAVVDLLEALNEQGEVAIITGRGIDDAKGRLGFQPTYIVGDHGRALKHINELLAGAESIDAFDCNCVKNVIVTGDPHKGDALLSLVERSGAGGVVFVSDDETAEKAFESLASRPNLPSFTVKIGDEDDSSAAFFLPSYDGVLPLLRQMVDIAKRRRKFGTVPETSKVV